MLWPGRRSSVHPNRIADWISPTYNLRKLLDFAEHEGL
jgi:hypothetical protein